MTESEYLQDVDFDDLAAHQVLGIFSYEEIENWSNTILEPDTIPELRMIPKSESVVRVQFPKRYGFYNPVFIRIVAEEFEITHWQILRSIKYKGNLLVAHIKENDCAVVIAPKANPRFVKDDPVIIEVLRVIKEGGL